MSTLLYYVIASNLLDAGAIDGDCLTMAWCLDQLTGDPVLTEELARSPSESLSLRIDVFDVRAGYKEEHQYLLKNMTPETLKASSTYEDAVKFAFGAM